MKKFTSLLFAIIFTLILSACSYSGQYQYITVDVEQFGISTGYSIAFPKGSAYTEQFNAVLTEMLNDGTLECFNTFWGEEQNETCYSNIDFTAKKYNLSYNGNGKELKVMTSSGYEPFEMLDDNGNLTGYDFDLAKFIAKELGYTLKWEDAEFDSIIASLTNNKIDLAIAAITPTEDRKKSVDFSIEYYNDSYTVAIFRSDDNFNSVDEMGGKTVAAQNGTVQADLIYHLKDEGRVRKVISVNYPAAAMQALKTNKIDVFFVEKSVADSLLQEYNKTK